MPPGRKPSASEIENKLKQKKAMVQFLSRVIKKTTRSDKKAKLTQELKRTEMEMRELKTASCKERRGSAAREPRMLTRKHIFYL